jgi:hypothetical protein
VAHAGAAHAQACCGGGNAAFPSRLPPHEHALVGVSLEARPYYAVWGPTGSVRAAGAADVEFATEPYAAFRVLPPLQVAVAVPFRLNVRSGAGSDVRVGGGLGDVRLTSRWDVLTTRERRFAPGVAVLGGVALPTGTSPEAAQDALATDATGTGSVRFSGGLAVEQASGPWLVGAAATGLLASPRSVGSMRVASGPEVNAAAFATYVWRGGTALATTVLFRWSAAPRVDGVASEDSSVRSLALQASLVVPIGAVWRLNASLGGEVPIPGVGANAPIGVRFVLGVQRGFVAQ